MALRQIKGSIYSVGVIDWDRRLFDELIHLPAGTTYNSYLIKGSEKVILIDTVDPSKFEEFIENINNLGVDKIDYIVCQHAEQDHSGSIPMILKRYPSAEIITNEKCKDLLIEHLDLNGSSFVIVNDGDELKIGDVSLKFIFAPWVHWPETMLTYYIRENALFTCDMFGSHLATHHLYSDEDDRLKLSAKRYFAEIMLPFRSHIRKHLEKIANYKIDMILPSHGPIHRKPEIILDYYRSWSSDETSSLVLVPYVSMHDSTEIIVKSMISELSKRDVDVFPINLAEIDIGEFAMCLIDASVVVFGVPTVLAGPHPIVAYSAMLMNALRPPTKGIGFVGSFGWGGKTEEVMRNLLQNIRYQDLGSIFIRGVPKREDRDKINIFSEKISLFIKDIKTR